MDVSIMIEGQMGLNWPRWKAVVTETERLGFGGLFRSDHFTNPGTQHDDDALELITSLTWLAANTERIRFGPLVAPVSFRDPVMFARQGAALADLSGGRFVLGIGAGWQQREHEMFGYELGDVATRMARLENALEVVTRLLREDRPVSHEGPFYSVRDAWFRPKPAVAPPVLVGGNGKRRTLALAAAYADEWNCNYQSPDEVRARCETLDGFLAERGRSPADVKRSMMTGVYTGADDAALARRFERFRDHPTFGGKPAGEVAAALREHGALAGPPVDVRAQLRALESAGLQEVMLQWLDLDDLDGLAELAEVVLSP